MSLRIKGQEVSLIITSGGDFLDELTDITDFNATFKLRKLEQGYLGQTSNQYDEIFDGADLTFGLHLHTGSMLSDFIPNIIKRAKRELPDLIINITALLAFPEGDRRVFFPDVKFGPLTQQIGSRGDYMKIGCDMSCSDPQFR